MVVSNKFEELRQELEHIINGFNDGLSSSSKQTSTGLEQDLDQSAGHFSMGQSHNVLGYMADQIAAFGDRILRFGAVLTATYMLSPDRRGFMVGNSLGLLAAFSGCTPKNAFVVDSVDDVKELDNLLIEFEDYVLQNSAFGEKLRPFFSQAPEPTWKRYDDYSSIRVKDGTIYFPHSDTKLKLPITSKNKIELDCGNPVMRLSYILNGIPLLNILRLYGTLSYFHHRQSELDILSEIVWGEGMSYWYSAENDFIIFSKRPVSSQPTRLCPNGGLRFTNEKLIHESNITSFEMRQLYTKAVDEFKWKTNSFNPNTFNYTIIEKRVYDILRRKFIQDDNAAILERAHLCFVASPFNLLNNQIGKRQIVERVSYITGGQENIDQIQNAVDVLERAYSVLLNPSMRESDAYMKVAEAVARHKNSIDDNGRYYGMEETVDEWEKQYGEGSLTCLNKRRKSSLIELKKEVKSLFEEFRWRKGYSGIVCNIESYRDDSSKK